jgi:hypothetical protein
VATLLLVMLFVQRATLKDYAVEGSAIGNTGATRTLDLENANFFSATLDQACDFTFSNPPGSGDFGAFVLELTNGGAFCDYMACCGGLAWRHGTYADCCGCRSASVYDKGCRYYMARVCCWSGY